MIDHHDYDARTGVTTLAAFFFGFCTLVSVAMAALGGEQAGVSALLLVLVMGFLIAAVTGLVAMTALDGRRFGPSA